MSRINSTISENIKQMCLVVQKPSDFDQEIGPA
jgi:hypothetical protein